MLLNLYQAGLDAGNSETTGAVFTREGQLATLTIPSYAGRGSFNDLRRFRQMRSAQVGNVLQPEEYVLHCLAIDRAEYFVGRLALTQSRFATSARGDINRYWSPLMLLLLLTVLGALIPDAEFEVSVVTVFPIETYSDQNRRKVRTALEGEHQFTLNGRPRRAIVHIAKVIMEGAGAMIASGEDRSIRQAVIDIGGRTTDLYTADGQMPLISRCKGTALGVELVGDLVNQTFQDRHGRVLTPQETHEIVRAAGGSAPYPSLYANGQEVSQIDLRRWTEGALGSIGRDITTFVSQTWASGEHGAVGTDLAKVLLVGGGAYSFYPAIAQLFPRVVVPPQPELANALGYAALAQHMGS
jgi:Actin like proteins N terminal domain